MINVADQRHVGVVVFHGAVGRLYGAEIAAETARWLEYEPCPDPSAHRPAEVEAS